MKKVKAPTSFDPGGGKPREHLAYLNKREMEFLRNLNGQGPYKGPKGIPSFVLGGFGSAGSGTYSSSGSQQKSASKSTAKSTGPTGGSLNAPSRTAPSKGSVTGARGGGGGGGAGDSGRVGGGGGGNFGGGGGGGGTAKSFTGGAPRPSNIGTGGGSGAVKSFTGGAPRPSNISTGGGPPRSISGIGSPVDDAVRQSVANRDAVKIARESPAYRSDAAKSPLKSPMGMSFNIGSGNISAAATSPIEGIEPPKGPMPQGIRSLATSAASLLDADPSWVRDTVDSLDPRYSTSGIFSNISDVFAPSNITKSVYDIGTGLIKSGVDFASDPYGTLGKGIGALGNYLKESYDLMGRAGMGEESAVGPAFLGALDFVSPAYAFGTAPAGALGSVIGRRTALPDIEGAMNYADDFITKYGLLNPEMQEDLFRQTAKMTPEWASGVQDLTGFGTYGIEAIDPFRFSRGVDAGIFKQSMTPISLGQIIEHGPTMLAYPQIMDTPVRYNLDRANIGSMGAYYPGGWEGYEGISGLGRYVRDTILGTPPGSFSPAIEVNAPFGTWSPQNEYAKTLAHEVGGHFTSDLAGLPAYSVSPRYREETLKREYPGADVNDLKKVAYDLYRYSPAESIAWNVENRIGVPESFAKDWENRFSTSYTPEDVAGVKRAQTIREIIEKDLGRKIP